MGSQNPADEAAEWLATLTDPSCTVEERQRFVEWLRRSNLHVDEFLRISALTQRLTRSGLWPQREIEELIARAHRPDGGSVTPFPDSSAQRARVDSSAADAPRWRWTLAAGTACLVALAALLLARFDPLGWSGGTYMTAIGELRSITLDDGSVVDLNTNSSVRTRFTESQRTVELLRGEAVFKVAKNSQRPFVVSAGSTEIFAVGTEFNVYARDTQTVVTVLEGRVRVMDKARRDLELAPGEQAVISPDLPIARVKLADSRQVTSWTERRLIFDDTPLSAAADEFARYNTRTIHIEDPKLRELRVTGVFNATDPASLVQFIEAYGNVSVSTNREGWTLVGNH